MSKQYLFRVNILNKKNKQPLESIAYFSGEKQFDVVSSQVFESSTESKVIWSDLTVPEKFNDLAAYNNLPDYLKLRSKKQTIISNARNILWQNINSRETRKDAQFARMFEVSIPYFIGKDAAIDLVKKFSDFLIKNGMIVDCSIHDHNKSDDQISFFEKIKNKSQDKEVPHQDYTGFLVCTLRNYSNGIFVNKNRDWNDYNNLMTWRGVWVTLLVETIAKANCSAEDLSLWEKKLSMYREFNDLKSKMSIKN
jgi:hypothetical protein